MFSHLHMLSILAMIHNCFESDSNWLVNEYWVMIVDVSTIQKLAAGNLQILSQDATQLLTYLHLYYETLPKRVQVNDNLQLRVYKMNLWNAEQKLAHQVLYSMVVMELMVVGTLLEEETEPTMFHFFFLLTVASCFQYSEESLN